MVRGWSSNVLAAGTLTLLIGAGHQGPAPRGMSGFRPPLGHTAPYFGPGASSPNRNDNSTKRRPAVTSRTSCRCEQLNSSPAPAAGRYSSGPYSLFPEVCRGQSRSSVFRGGPLVTAVVRWSMPQLCPKIPTLAYNPYVISRGAGRPTPDPGAPNL